MSEGVQIPMNFDTKWQQPSVWSKFILLKYFSEPNNIKIHDMKCANTTLHYCICVPYGVIHLSII